MSTRPEAFTVLFLYGLPACGKRTVAMELAPLLHFKCFDNHRLLDLLFSLWDFGSPSFVEFREELWIKLMRRFIEEECSKRQRAAEGRQGDEGKGDGREEDGGPSSWCRGLVFTFAPEGTVRDSFPRALCEMVQEASGGNGSVKFIELTCSDEAIRSRLGNASRADGGKLTDLALFEQLHSAGTFTEYAERVLAPLRHVLFDTTENAPRDVARMIQQWLQAQALA